MADRLPAGAPRVPPAKDSLARSFEQLNGEPRRPYVIHSPAVVEGPASARLAIAAWGAMLLAAVYVVVQVVRGLS